MDTGSRQTSGNLTGQLHSISTMIVVGSLVASDQIRSLVCMPAVLVQRIGSLTTVSIANVVLGVSKSPSKNRRHPGSASLAFPNAISVSPSTLQRQKKGMQLMVARYGVDSFH